MGGARAKGPQREAESNRAVLLPRADRLWSQIARGQSAAREMGDQVREHG
jgi:hypothetical protein